MNAGSSEGVKPLSAVTKGPPKAKWWGRYVEEGGPERYRLVLRWGRVTGVVGSVLLAVYLALATGLWAYYSVYRKIPGVEWVDVAVLPRFGRVQAAIGDQYFSSAKQYWENHNYIQGIFTARAAVSKSPRNLEARLFLSSCWLQAGRNDEAIRTLRDGLEFDASNPRLQRALVSTLITSARYADLLKLLRTDLPALGVKLLDGPGHDYQLVEVQAVLETAGPSEAMRVVGLHPGLSQQAAAAPLVSRIEWDSGDHDKAFAELEQAAAAHPEDAGIQDAYIDLALRLGKADLAKVTSAAFLKAFPNLLSARLRFMEARGSRAGDDATPWLDECARYLIQFRSDTSALYRLASLASSQGWTDVTYLLYQNGLQENMSGFPFAIYYVGSLIEAKEIAAADEVWHELSLRNASELAQASYLGAMIASSEGHESEVLQTVEQIRKDTAADLPRRKAVAEILRHYGYPQIADGLMGVETPAAP